MLQIVTKSMAKVGELPFIHAMMSCNTFRYVCAKNVVLNNYRYRWFAALISNISLEIYKLIVHE